MTSFRILALSLTSLLPSCTCFIGSTRIQTPSGPKPISRLRAGDRVLSQDLSTGRVVSARVVRFFAHSKRPLGRISGTSLHGVTANHPIYLPQRRAFVRADRIGSDVHLLKYDAVCSKEFRSFGYEESPAVEEPVFNIEVEETHNYFAEDILVHNKTTDFRDEPDQGEEMEMAQSHDCGAPTAPFAEPCADAVLSDAGPPLEILSEESACSGDSVALGGSFGKASCPPEEGTMADLNRDVVLYLPEASVEGLACENYDLIVSAVAGPVLLEFFEPGLDRCVASEDRVLSSHTVIGSDFAVALPKTRGGITLRFSSEESHPVAVRLSLRARELQLDP